MSFSFNYIGNLFQCVVNMQNVSQCFNLNALSVADN
jgi:hypothetical protein